MDPADPVARAPLLRVFGVVNFGYTRPPRVRPHVPSGAGEVNGTRPVWEPFPVPGSRVYKAGIPNWKPWARQWPDGVECPTPRESPPPRYN